MMRNKTSHRSILVALFTFTISLSAFSQVSNDEVAKRLFQKVSKLEQTTPKGDPFAKWTVSIAKLTSEACFESLLGVDQKKVATTLIAKGLNAKDVQAYFSGKTDLPASYQTYSAPDLKALCPLLATDGFRPSCRAARPVTIEPVFKRQHRYPIDYIVLRSGVPHAINLSLECNISSEAKDSQTATRFPRQVFSFQGNQIAKIESFAITKWTVFGNKLVLTPKRIDATYKNPTPLNLGNQKNITNLMVTNLSLQLKSPAQKFEWPIAIEP